MSDTVSESQGILFAIGIFLMMTSGLFYQDSKQYHRISMIVAIVAALHMLPLLINLWLTAILG